MMTADLEKLNVAIEYVSRMAEGRNPVKNTLAVNDSVINDPNVIRCMYFIRDVLQMVQANKGVIGGTSKKDNIPFPYSVLERFKYVKPLPITRLMNQLKELADDENIKAPSYRKVTDWLKYKGYLSETEDRITGKKKTLISPEGEAFGLYPEHRTSINGKEYDVIMYSQKAQEYIVKNLEAIINGEVLES